MKSHELVPKLKPWLLPPAYVVRREGNSFTLFVCPHLGGGVRSVSRRGGSGPAGGGSGPASWGGSGPAGGVRSSWRGSGPAGGGGVRSSRGGQVQLRGGVGQVQPAGGVRSSWQGGVSQPGGVSILRPLAGGMPLAFTQEVFLVYLNEIPRTRTKAKTMVIYLNEIPRTRTKAKTMVIYLNEIPRTRTNAKPWLFLPEGNPGTHLCRCLSPGQILKPGCTTPEQHHLALSDSDSHAVSLLLRSQHRNFANTYCKYH